MTGIEIPAVWIEAAAGGVVSAFGGMAGAIVALWRRQNALAAECAAERAANLAQREADRAAFANRERELTDRWLAEVRARVRDFNAPPPEAPTCPPPPESEPTGTRRLRDLVSDAELDAILSDYAQSIRAKRDH